MSEPEKPCERLGLIGDVHCEDKSLALAIETLRKAGFETLVCTGDIPTGRGNINRCSLLLRMNKIATIRGNHDRWLLRGTLGGLPYATHPSEVDEPTWRFLESLPVTREIVTSRGLAQLCHGLGEDDMESIMPGQPEVELDDHPILHAWRESMRYRFVLNGHSHHRMVRQHHSFTIINAGTLRRDHQPCFAAIDFGQGCVSYWDVLPGPEAVLVEQVSLNDR